MWRIKAFSSGPYKPGDRKTEDSALKHTSYSASKRDTERWGCEAGLEIKLAAEKTSCLEHIWRSGPLNNELINIANPNSSGGIATLFGTLTKRKTYCVFLCHILNISFLHAQVLFEQIEVSVGRGFHYSIES